MPAFGLECADQAKGVRRLVAERDQRLDRIGKVFRSETMAANGRPARQLRRGLRLEPGEQLSAEERLAVR